MVRVRRFSWTPNEAAKVSRRAVHQAEGSSVESEVTTAGAGLRAISKGVEEPPDPKVRASLQGTTVVEARGMHSKE